jgi:general secretion pathway protein C
VGLNDNRPMAARLSAFVIWALVAAGTVFWGYRFWAPTTPLPANVQVVGEGVGPRADLTRLLGSGPAVDVDAEEPAQVAESSRFRLLGVLAPKPASTGAPSRGGVALIAVDGKRPRAYAVGARVEGDLLLSAVSHRSASLAVASGGQPIVLELPPLVPPATGTLPRAVAGADGAPPPPGMAPPPGGMAGGASPGSPARAATYQAQQAQQAQAAAADDADDDDDPPTPAAQARPRVGGPASR